MLVLSQGWLVPHLLERSEFLEHKACYQKEAKDISSVGNIYAFQRPCASEGVRTNSIFPTMDLELELCLALAQGGKKEIPKRK